MSERHVGLGEKFKRRIDPRKGVGVCPLRGLVQYQSRSAAKKAAKGILSAGRGVGHGEGLHEFQCQTCHQWHLGK